MRFLPLTSALTTIIFTTSSLMTYADSPQTAQSLQATCTKAWMGRINDIKDKLDYQNFGEKYCTCAVTQPLTDAAAIEKAAQVCMSRTLLHDTMDSLETDVGLSDTTPGDIIEYCQDRWSLIYPQMNENDKKATATYCSCAKPQLLELIKKSEKITDQAYALEIDGIAADCSGKVKADETTTNAVH